MKRTFTYKSLIDLSTKQATNQPTKNKKKMNTLLISLSMHEYNNIVLQTYR